MKVLLKKRSEGESPRLMCENCQAVVEVESSDRVQVGNISLLPMIGKERYVTGVMCCECGAVIKAGNEVVYK